MPNCTYVFKVPVNRKICIHFSKLTSLNFLPPALPSFPLIITLESPIPENVYACIYLHILYMYVCVRHDGVPGEVLLQKEGAAWTSEKVSFA